MHQTNNSYVHACETTPATCTILLGCESEEIWEEDHQEQDIDEDVFDLASVTSVNQADDHHHSLARWLISPTVQALYS